MGHNIEKDEAYMRATMVEYIVKKAEVVTSVARDFLKCKGQTLADYLHFIRVPGNKGDKLAIHILACMTNLKVVVVTKTRFWSTVMDCDPLSADVILVYLGKSTKQNVKFGGRMCQLNSIYCLGCIVGLVVLLIYY